MKTVYFPGTDSGIPVARIAPGTAMGQRPDLDRHTGAIASIAVKTEVSGASDSPAAPGTRDNAASAMDPGIGGERNPAPFWKRTIDLAGCAIALPFLALFTLGMAILTKCVSPGPIFFRQERIGYRGRRYSIYKFRTMHAGADCAVHRDYLKDLIGSNAPMSKLDSRGDSRLIPLAWLLRASGMDELPQVINVLRGEMSLVGPRPCLPNEFEHYRPWQRRRCDALPGLTGLWQVSGKNRTTFEQMIGFDIKYSREFSFWLDLKIIFLTVPSLLGQVSDIRQARRMPPKPELPSAAPVPQRAPSSNG